MAKCYKLRYINKIMLFFEFQKGGFDPQNRVHHCLAVTDVNVLIQGTVNRGDFERRGDFEHFTKTNFVFS